MNIKVAYFKNKSTHFLIKSAQHEEKIQTEASINPTFQDAISLGSTKDEAHKDVIEEDIKDHAKDINKDMFKDTIQACKDVSKRMAHKDVSKDNVHKYISIEEAIKDATNEKAGKDTSTEKTNKDVSKKKSNEEASKEEASKHTSKEESFKEVVEELNNSKHIGKECVWCKDAYGAMGQKLEDNHEGKELQV